MLGPSWPGTYGVHTFASTITSRRTRWHALDDFPYSRDSTVSNPSTSGRNHSPVVGDRSANVVSDRCPKFPGHRSVTAVIV